MGLINFISKGLRVDKKSKEQEITLASPMEFVQEPCASTLNNNHAFEQQRAFDQMMQNQTHTGRQILVVVPHTNQDVNNIVANLQNNEACVIDFEQIPLAEAQRRLDFLSGVICAIDGAIRPLDKHKYILTPRGMSVRQFNG